jgi:stage II sporulation protein D
MRNMNIKLCAMCVAMLAMQLPAHAGIVDLLRSAFIKQESIDPPSIRVLLAHDQPGVILEVKGKYKIIDPRTNATIGSSFQGKRRMLQAIPSGIRWGEEFPGVYQIAIVGDSNDTTIIVDSVEYRGVIYAYNVGGSISIVNKVNVEEYLSSVLPHAYQDPLPHELLSAAAIVSRTQAYYLAHNSRTPFWDVDAEHEGYRGQAVANRYKAIDSAIQDTQYMVLNRSGKGDWSPTPFSVAWKPQPQSGAKVFKDKTYSVISFDEALALAKKGENAPDILRVAFPDTTIKLEYATPAALLD